MSIAETINADIKAAMLAREKGKLESLRAVKSALLLAGTAKGGDGTVSDEVALKEIQKLVKQRKDAATIFREQGRVDLAEVEESQTEVLSVYLPAQMSEGDVRAALETIIANIGASGPGDMGKVMGSAMGQLSGKADGKMISALVKELLS